MIDASWKGWKRLENGRYGIGKATYKTGKNCEQKMKGKKRR